MSRQRRFGELSPAAKCACAIGLVAWFGGGAFTALSDRYGHIDPVIGIIVGGIIGLACYFFVLNEIAQ